MESEKVKVITVEKKSTMSLEDMMDLVRIQDLNRHYDALYEALFGTPVVIGGYEDGMFSCVELASNIIERNSILADEDFRKEYYDEFSQIVDDWNRPVEERARLLLGMDEFVLSAK